MSGEYYDGDLALSFGSSILDQKGLINDVNFNILPQRNYSFVKQLNVSETLPIEIEKPFTAVDVQKFPEREIPEDKIIVGQRNIKFVAKITGDNNSIPQFSPKKYLSFLHYPGIQEFVKLNQTNNIDSNLEKVSHHFERIRRREWPADMQPADETIDRAESLWRRIQQSIFYIGAGVPNISAADENSIDMFWGDQSNRVLLNIPSSLHDPLFIHLIDENGQTVVNFTDSHVFNIINLLTKMSDRIGS